MHTHPATRATGRRRRRLLAALTTATALTLVVTGCTLDAAAQARKASGHESLSTQNAMPSLAGKFDSIDKLTLEEGPADPTAGLNAGQKLMLGTERGIEDSDNVRIHLTIASPQVELVRFGETYRGDQKPCPALEKLPRSVEKIAAGSTGESCVEAKGANDISQELTYRLPGTKQLFWVYVKNPFIGDRELQCGIFDPTTWKPVNTTETSYTCDKRWEQDNKSKNPMPRVRLMRKNTVEVTDPVQAQKLLKENCNKNQPECVYTSVRQRVVSPPTAEWTLLDMYANCGPDKHESAEHAWEQEKEFEGKYTVGAEGSFGYGNPAHDKIAAKIKVQFKHIWTVKDSYKVKVDQPVPYGTANLFYAGVSYLELTGDFTITTKDNVYIIKDTTYKLPLKDNWTDDHGNTVEFLQTESFGAGVTCDPMEDEKDHGPKLTAKVQKQLDRGVIPSLDELLAAGAMPASAAVSAE